MLKMSKAFAVRMTLWSVLVLYMLMDFYLINGPVKRELRLMFPNEGDEQQEALRHGICAKVYDKPIYQGQLERRLVENLWRRGRKLDQVSESEMTVLKQKALNDLIDEALVRVKVWANKKEVSVSEAEINAEVAGFKNRFDSSEDLEQAMKAQGIESQKELRYKLAARLEQEKYVLSKIQGAIYVSDEEAKAWFEKNKGGMNLPERRRVRHIFFATLDHDSDFVRARAGAYVDLLNSGEREFEKLALDVSEDERTKNKAGDLSWMTRERVKLVFPAFADQVFSMPVGGLRLIQSKIGWHIVEVTEMKEVSELPYEQVKEEVITSLRDSRKKNAIKLYKDGLRQRGGKYVKVYGDVVAQLDL